MIDVISANISKELDAALHPDSIIKGDRKERNGYFRRNRTRASRFLERSVPATL